MRISVITPTYNRAYILPQCYKSLCEQTSKNFEWIVVNDGSNDNTDQVVESFINEGKIDIKYFRQENGGKHRAHNSAVKYASGELTICLDSDDQLAPEAIEQAISTWTNRSTENTIGIMTPRGDFHSHAIICSEFPKGLEYSTGTELRDCYGFEGDTALFFRTNLLKNHPFREFEGENFLTENNLYCELDGFGKMILLPTPLYYCEYRPDGLSAKYHKLLFDNPKGAADTYYRMTLSAASHSVALKYAIIADAYNNLLPTEKRLKFKEKRILMTIACIFAPFFKILYLKNLAK